MNRALHRLFSFVVLALLAMSGHATIYYVTTGGSADNTGTSWSAPKTLENALSTATAGDTIFVAQGTYKAPDPTYDESTEDYIHGFILKPGVRLYGGFMGTETSISEREYSSTSSQMMKNQTILSGDKNGDDKIDDTYLIYYGNETRDNDNSKCVLSIDMAGDGGLTVVNGFTITGGHAFITNGGGIYIGCSSGSSSSYYRIENCFFVNNDAPLGGAIYVDESFTNISTPSVINKCIVYNNAAGTRGTDENAGGGIYLAGAGTVVNTAVFNNVNGGICLSDKAEVINSTVARNTSSGIDIVDGSTQEDVEVWNTVVWGNSNPYLSTSTMPDFHYSAHSNVTSSDGNGNIYVDPTNRASDGPQFAYPTNTAAFDRTFSLATDKYPTYSWELEEVSVLRLKGDNTAYNTYSSLYGDVDLYGNSRIAVTIDIGAAEYPTVSSDRILYVTESGAGNRDGSSWDNAMSNPQTAINRLAETSGRGEVWIAGGTYMVSNRLDENQTRIFFYMRDGISVYGGFSGTDDNETKETRAIKTGGMPWDFVNETIFQGSSYTSGSNAWSSVDRKWNVSSQSRHVVWFAPLQGEDEEGDGFTYTTYLNGVTIEGGYAQGGEDEYYEPSKGGGVYLGANARLQKCIVRNNTATDDGGGVYVDGGRVESSLIYNNSSDADGGGVYMDNTGIVLRSMVTNNSANNGGGVYLNHDDATQPQYYLLLSTSIVSNNTNRENGAVYANNGGVVVHSTIVNNSTPRATDSADDNASRTGGLYINQYGIVVNSVLANNSLSSSVNNAQMYAKDPSSTNVRFYNTGLTSSNSSVWNNIYQTGTIELSSDSPSYYFSTGGVFDSSNAFSTTIGVQGAWTEIDYYWTPVKGSFLRGEGLMYGSFPSEVLVKPELDVAGNEYEQKPTIGAQKAEAMTIVPELSTDGKTLRVYMDTASDNTEADGSMWANGTVNMAYGSLNEIVEFLSELTTDVDDEITVYNKSTGEKETLAGLNGIEAFEVYVRAGDLYPRYQYTSNNEKSATFYVDKMASGLPLSIYGGYPEFSVKASPTESDRLPMTYRSDLNGNYSGTALSDGLYHVVTVEAGANVTLDGFVIRNGYAVASEDQSYGGGMLVFGSGDTSNPTTVTVKNSIFENNTATSGAAIYAGYTGASVTLQNCVVNNNTNTSTDEKIIDMGTGTTTGTLTLDHVSVINNIGVAPDAVKNTGSTSYAAGNVAAESDVPTGTDDAFNNTIFISTLGSAGAANFANPTNYAGARFSGNAYLGGNTEYRPLTSSTDAGTTIINQAGTSTDDLSIDITCSSNRSLGGASDLGAYEADLPETGSVLYVRTASDGGDDAHDGQSWGTAFATLEHALSVAGSSSYATAADRPDIWVAAGTYTHCSTDTKVNHKYAYYFVEGSDVYGGFPASGCPGIDDQSPKEYETILQLQEPLENIDTDDTDDLANTLESRTTGRVLVQESAFTTETKYDGFTLQGGYLYACYRQDIGGVINSLSTTNVGSQAGAGVYIITNGTLENCEIQKNIIYVKPHSSSLQEYPTSGSGGYHQAGAGVYCNGGTIKNSVITDNRHYHLLQYQSGYSDGEHYESAWMYGTGLFMHTGTVYNTLISDNVAEVLGKGTDGTYLLGWFEVIAGSGAFIYSGNFYNNTIVGNQGITRRTSRWNVSIPGVYVFSSATLYNCIVSGNTYNTEATSGGNAVNGVTTRTVLGYPVCSFSNAQYSTAPSNVTVKYSCVDMTYTTDTSQNLCTTNDSNPATNVYTAPVFVDADNGDYRLAATSTDCINSGTEDEDLMGVTIPDYDADYTNRIKDCTIDMGAYERDNSDNIAATSSTYTSGTATKTLYTYYVTQNGAGTRSGENPTNAACAEKLQDVLTVAGENITNNVCDSAIVKVAGYEVGSDGDPSFTYHANTLAISTDPQSYTYVIPDGVTLMGGYNENATTGQDNHWDKDQRDVTKYRTVLSAKTEASTGSTVTADVNGYHAVTFGVPTTVDGVTTYKSSLDRGITIDGVYLTEGAATEDNGNRAYGGGAIVPSGGNIRNCVIYNNEALYGGGLYLCPGAIVSGCLITDNTARYGGGIYGDNGDIAISDTTTNRSHVVSSTIVANTATASGGGTYHENGAMFFGNAVIWGNTAPLDKNVGGTISGEFTDPVMRKQAVLGTQRFYPYNECFVESYELPANTRNTEMTSETTTYFKGSTSVTADDGTTVLYTYVDYAPHPFSPLVNEGVMRKYHTIWMSECNVLDYDMCGNDWTPTESQSNGNVRLTAGAYADNSDMPTNVLVTRLFVSKTGGVLISDTARDKYIGRSFYTPLNSLDDALEYIRTMRSTKDTDGNYYATDATHFEIFMAEGTYKPSKNRYADYDTSGLTGDNLTYMTVMKEDPRFYSFNIPVNVSIYGGFSGYSSSKSTSEIDNYSFDIENIYYNGTSGTALASGLTKAALGTDGTTLTETDMSAILAARNAYDHMDDMNNNSLLEPWGFKYQTVLSGEVNTNVGTEATQSSSNNAFHIVYTTSASSTSDYNNVTIDGVTIMHGEATSTYSDISDAGGTIVVHNDYEKYGGGIYSDGVNVTLAHARVIYNVATNGAGAYVNNATLNVIGSVFGGNLAYNNGGAAYVGYEDANGTTSMNAINSLWTNNEARSTTEDSPSRGGAMYVSNGTVDLMNNIIARNKADEDPAIVCGSSGLIRNTVIWGNEGTSSTTIEYSADADGNVKSGIVYCASDKVGNTIENATVYHNVKLGDTNMASDGPRFTNPSTTAGVDGNQTSATWNPAAISVLTDAGTGQETADGTTRSGAYEQWWIDHGLTAYYNSYIIKASASSNDYPRYMGPTDENGVQMDKVIDIGLYEYQYVSDFASMTAVYIAPTGSGDQSGDSWVNASSDLRGAIIALANATAGKSTVRTIYVRDGDYGEYFSPSLDGGTAYPLVVKANNTHLTSLTIKGSCTGIGSEQDFSNQTILTYNSSKTSATQRLMSVTTAGIPVTIEGFTFVNDTTVSDYAGDGLQVQSTSVGGKLTLKNCGFRDNDGNGVTITEAGSGSTGTGNYGEVLIYNTLFADNDGTGLIANASDDGKTTVVNATFAQNGTDVTNSNNSALNIYNTVSWENTKQNLVNDTETNHNVSFASGTANASVSAGPNFVDPTNETILSRDYSIRPSKMLLNKGDSTLYYNNVGVYAGLDVDLASNSRLTDSEIEVGAYEYDAELIPIIYVSNTITSNATGASWDSPLTDLQSAVDQAGLFYENTDENNRINGYVFVDKNYSASDLNITLDGAKIYGGMNEEYISPLTEPYTKAGVEASVDTLLNARLGMLESTSYSTINGLTLGANSVVDGFKLTGTVAVNNGTLSTSVIDNSDAGVTGTSSGLLYNSLVLGPVSGVKTINVTATETIGAVTGNYNNRESVSEINSYVTDDYWKYQLNETSTDIDVADDNSNRYTATNIGITAVDHDRDLAGNKRIRNNDLVDNGCFETWDINTNSEEDTIVTSSDYPHGKSVVYVRNNKEIVLNSGVYTSSSNTFSPGFLLLEHHAGLRGNDNYVSLSNFAVERNVAANDTTFAVMPFAITSMSTKVGSNTATTGSITNAMRYDGKTRSGSSFKYDAVNGNAWEAATISSSTSLGTEGFALWGDATDATVYRFYGNAYSEGGTDKSISLIQYNENTGWTGSSSSFTYKENMGWNLFGSPYLCSMNYSDMEYGRVIYGYKDNGYTTVNTTNVTDGYIPAGDAVFTQTATLKTTETISVDRTEAKVGEEYNTGTDALTVSLTRVGETRSGEGTTGDVLQLTAVEPSDAKSDFDISSDGVKWMSGSDVPQLYASRNSGRYSLLSA
ncbi:MAG: hypothetical protein Q4D41_04035, partial [Prevotellaceae bacterium]|nr:hypothetical protein [Prevotellaceae bacterium]